MKRACSRHGYLRESIQLTHRLVPLWFLIVGTGQIGDDMDADLGKGTWQLGLRRVLGEYTRL